jgi:monovalent cation:H+ antiporter-2, CPA2 family
MAAPINIDAFSDALVVLATAGVVIPVVRRWGISPILGYLGAGAVLGPLGLGSFIDRLPFLYWFTVVDAKNVAGIAELGVVFLLFLIGLELSYDRLKTMRRLVFGLGSLQVILSAAVISGIASAGRQQARSIDEATLVGLGLPAGPVIASVHEMRDEFRRELQQAAGKAGLETTRSIRTKTLRSS